MKLQTYLSFDAIQNPNHLTTLCQQARETFDLLKPLFNDYDNLKLMFHPQLNEHHMRHARDHTWLLKDLLFVSDSYLEMLPTVYDIALLKAVDKRLYYFKDRSLLEGLREPKNEVLFFLINASEILSLHVQQGRTEYCETIATDVTHKNIQLMIEIGYTLEEASTVLGSTSPHKDILLSDEFDVINRTAAGLLETTEKGILCIPNIRVRMDTTNINADQRCDFDNDLAQYEKPIETPNFAIPDPNDDNLLRAQINKFLPTRELLKKAFWARYEKAHCLMP
jgi:hypothetical protein